MLWDVHKAKTYNSNSSSNSGLRSYLLTWVQRVSTIGKTWLGSRHSCTNGSLRPGRSIRHLFVIPTFHYHNNHMNNSAVGVTIRVHWKEVDCIQYFHMEHVVWFPVGYEKGDSPIFLSTVAFLSYTQTKHFNNCLVFVVVSSSNQLSHLLWDFVLKKFLHKLLAAQAIVSQVCFEGLSWEGNIKCSITSWYLLQWPYFMFMNSPCSLQNGVYSELAHSLQRRSTAPYTDVHTN